MPTDPRRRWIGLWIALLCVAGSVGAAAPRPDRAELRGWIEQMKQSPKGPFQAIRWFCNDGTIQPPKAYACADRGGGIQHGLWTERVERLRAGGYKVANVLAELEADSFSGPEADLDALKQILIERFLIQADDGWIFRGARSYRGAFQIEDEEAGAAAALQGMARDPAWRRAERFELFREAVRLLPRQADATTSSEVRQLAVVIADKDPGFASLRAKIHNVPDAKDARRVREYAASSGKPQVAAEYERIASAIDSLYASRASAAALLAIAEQTADAKTAAALRAGASELRPAANPGARFEIAARLLPELRERFATAGPDASIALLRASIVVENEAFTAGSALLERLADDTRSQRLAHLEQAGSALYGAGLLSQRQLGELRSSIARLRSESSVPVDRYRSELHYLARAPEWASRWLAYLFSIPVEKLSEIEPLAHLYSQDRMRGSPLLFYTAVLDSLVLDANRLAGIEHELFGKKIGAGLRALNPGLSRGVLRATDGDSFRRDGIYLLPETVSDLPPVSGILTLGEGSSLSHVQLLARNLGIPNVVVSEELLESVWARIGEPVVLAVSPSGVVQLARDGPRWDAIFGSGGAAGGELVIRPNLEKLDIESTEFVPLGRLRATDSGRSSGPKGANLGELKHHFGDAVPPGFVIPFGAFRKLLDQPLEPGGPSVFEWMKQRYAEIASLDAEPELQQRAVSEFLARLRHWIETCDPGPAFEQSLRRALEENFGPDGSFGVFIRSDTNVEDLPGFTGAGLNLTLPNVVGYANILDAIRKVWASPFEDRSYGWRQGNMENPEYVFPAVVVQYSFPAEKSGVMVTADVDTGSLGTLSVAVNEGVGGAVEGQAAEALRIDTRTGEVRFLAQATAPLRTALPLSGGVVKRPATGTEELLKPAEIEQLIAMADEVSRFPTLRDEAGNPMPADVEFAFKDGRLALLQIRPFVESKRAQQNLYLAELDAALRERRARRVDLEAVPAGRQS